MQNDRPVRDGLRSVYAHPGTLAAKRMHDAPWGHESPVQSKLVQ
jgi:hypothetical protein